MSKTPSTFKKISLIALLLIVSGVMIFGVLKFRADNVSSQNLSSLFVFGNNEAGVTNSKPTPDPVQGEEAPILNSNPDSPVTVTDPISQLDESNVSDSDKNDNLDDTLTFEIIDHDSDKNEVAQDKAKDVEVVVSPAEAVNDSAVNFKEAEVVSPVEIDKIVNIPADTASFVASEESRESSPIKCRSIETQTEPLDENVTVHNFIDEILEKVIDASIIDAQSTPLHAKTEPSTAADVAFSTKESNFGGRTIVPEPVLTSLSGKQRPKKKSSLTYDVLESLCSFQNNHQQLKFVYIYVFGFKPNSVMKSINKSLGPKLLGSVSISADEGKGEATISFSEKNKHSVSANDITDLCSKLTTSSTSEVKCEMRINKKHKN